MIETSVGPHQLEEIRFQQHYLIQRQCRYSSDNIFMVQFHQSRWTSPRWSPPGAFHPGNFPQWSPPVHVTCREGLV